MLNLSLPYMTKGKGIGGKIKSSPEDFIVEEIPLYEPCGKGEHLYINITKENLTTRDVQKKLAELFGLTMKNIGVAGLKDKNARTTQTFSLQTDIDPDEAIEKIKEIDVKVNWAKYHTNKLRIGHSLGNKFRIIITDVGEDALKQAEKIAEEIKKNGLPNFFGMQRLSGENAENGLKIIRGELKMRDRWLGRYLISAYQSYLCNKYLIKRIETGNFSKMLKGDVAKKYETGGLFTVEDVKTDQKRYENKEISFTAPIYGDKMWEAVDESGELEKEVLKESDISIEDLKKVKIKGTRRLGRLLINELEVNENEKGIELIFSLPKGAFATIVLREFMKDI